MIKEQKKLALLRRDIGHFFTFSLFGRCPKCHFFSMYYEYERNGLTGKMVRVFCGQKNCDWNQEVEKLKGGEK